WLHIYAKVRSRKVAFQPGEIVTIEILRGDNVIQIQVTFGETTSG
ncbi:unnamed protein product, partial [marine sediment metagenome]